MSGNYKSTSRYFVVSSHLINWILDSGALCHITAQVSDFIPNLLEDTDKYIGVMNLHHVTSKQKVQAQINMCDDNVDPFITTFSQRTFSLRYL